MKFVCYDCNELVTLKELILAIQGEYNYTYCSKCWSMKK